MRWLLTLAAVILATGCPHRSQVALLAVPGRVPVEVGHYPDFVEILHGNHDYGRQVAELRRDIETHESVLRRLVRAHIDLKAPLEFEFKYAAVDSSRTRLVLRYFAPDPSPHLLAGWEALIVYSLPRCRLLSVRVAEVPLE